MARKPSVSLAPTEGVSFNCIYVQRKPIIFGVFELWSGTNIDPHTLIKHYFMFHMEG